MSSWLVGPRCTSRTISLWLLHTLCRTCFGFQTLSCQHSNSAPNVFLDLSGLVSPTRTTHTNSEGFLRSTWWVDWRDGISLLVKLINNYGFMFSVAQASYSQVKVFIGGCWVSCVPLLHSPVRGNRHWPQNPVIGSLSTDCPAGPSLLGQTLDPRGGTGGIVLS